MGVRSLNVKSSSKDFQRIMTHTLSTQHLSPEAIAQLLNYLPDYIKAALLEQSTELECSLETTIEMAITTEMRARSLIPFQFQQHLPPLDLRSLTAVRAIANLLSVLAPLYCP
jgi:hypothetical protein